MRRVEEVAKIEAAAVLRAGDDDRVVDPENLQVMVVRVLGPVVGQARILARRTGRVVERDALSVLTWGVAAWIELPRGLGADGAAAEAVGLLGRLGSPREPSRTLGVPPVALGALPFDRLAPGRLIIPEVSVVVGDDRPAVAIVVGDEATISARLSGFPFEGAEPDGAEPDDGELPDHFELTSPVSHRAFRGLVGQAVAAIRSGMLDKVVLAREVQVVANRPLRQDDLLGRLRALHPSCTAFGIDGFLGASPELLCRRAGAVVTSTPLAGTVARSGDPDEDRRLAVGLLSSEKDRAEHAVVVETIVAGLAGHCVRVETTGEPTVLELRNVAHLATTVTGQLRPERAGGNGMPSALELAATLHPTPAVGGFPRAEALAYLARHEGLDRDRYAGPVGFVDATGDGEWWVGIRSAIVDGCRARLLAGVGVVAGSDPAGELAETQLKLQALLAVAVRP